MKIPGKALEMILSAYPSGVCVKHNLGGADGVVFGCESRERALILKIIPTDEKGLERIRAQEGFRQYLERNGVPVAALVSGSKDERVVCCRMDGNVYAATLHARIPGRAPNLHDVLTKDTSLLEEWGTLLGRMHALSPGYEHGALADWQDECCGFEKWCIEDGIRQKWGDFRKNLKRLPRESHSYGVVHNDLHSENLVVSSRGLVAIDFGVSCYHWFCTDIGVVAFLWAWLEQPRSGETRQEMFMRHFDRFYAGYLREHQLSDAWLARLPLFVDYRRLLLYTVFSSDWGDELNSWQSETLACWRRAILADEPVIKAL